MTTQTPESGCPHRPRVRLLVRGVGVVMVAALVVLAAVSCAVSPPRRSSVDGVERLAALDRPWPGLREPVSVGWDTHLIPSIDATSDDDVAYALGLVHAHLRLAQMELLRRISQGRLAEMVGPFAAGVDEAIRAIDLGRAVPAMERRLPSDTRRWIERYVEGVNDYRARVPGTPSDARTLGFDYAEEPWTVADVLRIGRLASVDVHWGRWLALLPLREEAGFEEFAARLWAFGDAGIASFGPEQPHELGVLTDIGRTGSNAIVVSGRRSASGGALVASDPHLGLPQPNIWCVVGLRTPGRAVVGLSIPGLPFVLVGRNEHIAWTGTNMQASSSVLYRLGEGWEPTGERSEPVKVRWWFDRTVTVRESLFGPVVTDAELLRRLGEGDIAMRWRGHEASDEATPFHLAGTTHDWHTFRANFASYAAGGQNILYADAAGNIGQLMAIEAVPAAASASRVGVVDAGEPGFAWGRGVPSDILPYAFNPPEGYLLSANNTPARVEPVLVAQGNANDRVTRLRDLLEAADSPLDLDDLARLQLDTYSASSHRAAGRIATKADPERLSSGGRRVLGDIRSWDGRYASDSVGALAYQRTLSSLIDALYADRYAPPILRLLRSGAYVHDFVREDLEDPESGAMVARALEAAADAGPEGETWGDVHRLRLAHPIGLVPVFGRGYVFGDLPYSGSTTTVMKSAHSVQPDRHRTTFGANARLLCDMGTLDGNRVVLLGGQDGWLGSDRLLDQVPLWMEGRAAPLPLSREGQARRAVRRTDLRPPTP